MLEQKHILLTSFNYKEVRKKYKYVLQSEFTIKLNNGWKGFYQFSESGNIWGVLTDDILTIYAGYAWDGCTGAPDKPGNILASLLHDFLYQFGKCNAWTKSDADIIFYYQMKQDNFKLAPVYFTVVFSIGYVFFNSKNKATCVYLG